MVQDGYLVEFCQLSLTKPALHSFWYLYNYSIFARYMKKAVAIILAVLYLGVTSGFAVNIHYCMGKIAEVKFNDLDKSGCVCKSEKPMPCCNHEFHLFKVNDAHQQATETIAPPVTVAEVLHIYSLFSQDILQRESNIHFNSSLLLFSPPDIYLVNQVFRI